MANYRTLEDSESLDEALEAIRVYKARTQDRLARAKDTCAICLGLLARPQAVLECRHRYCYSCIRHWCESTVECPKCRKPIRTLEIDVKALLRKCREQGENEQNSVMIAKYKGCWERRGTRLFEDIPAPESYSEQEPSSDSQSATCVVCQGEDDQSQVLVCVKCSSNPCHQRCDPRLYCQPFPPPFYFCFLCQSHIR